jgi:tetratricopeptide (TPR) repeat protein
MTAMDKPLWFLTLFFGFLLIPSNRVGAHDPNLNAINEYNDILSKDPDNLEALKARGSTFRALELFDNALLDLERAAELDKDDPEVLAEIGMCHYQLGERGPATEYMDRAEEGLVQKVQSGVWEREKYAPIERELRAYRFRNFKDLGAYDKALEESEKLKEYLAGKLSYMCDVGDVLLALDRVEEALAYFKQAVVANPTFERYCVGAANCYLRLGRVEEALGIFRAWKSEEPGAALPLLHEAFILKIWLKDEAASKPVLARGEELLRYRIDGEEWPDPEDQIHLSRILQAAGRYQEAWVLLEELLEDFRWHWLVVHLQGVNARVLGRTQEADSLEKESRLYKRLNPDDWLQAYDLVNPKKPEPDPASSEPPPEKIHWIFPAGGGLLVLLFLVWIWRRRTGGNPI